MEKELLKYKTGATVVKITYMKKTDIITMEANGGYSYSQYWKSDSAEGQNNC